MLYILPVLALLWIPGIVGLTAEPNATVWEVQLVSYKPVLADSSSGGLSGFLSFGAVFGRPPPLS